MKCCTVTCSTPATHRVNWPGQEKDMCRACARRAQRVAEAMGFKLSTIPLAELRATRAACTALSSNGAACCLPMQHVGVHFSLDHDEAWT